MRLGVRLLRFSFSHAHRRSFDNRLSVRSIDKNDTLQGFISKRKRHVSKDRDLLARLEALIAKGASDGEFSPTTMMKF